MDTAVEAIAEYQDKHSLVLDLYAKGILDIEIARQLGISRERVRQLRNDLGLPRQAFKVIYVCHVCGCHMSERRMYCEKCAFDLYHETKSCNSCGKPITRSKSLWRGNLAFCDRQCQGRWLGLKYGRGGNESKNKCPSCGGNMLNRTSTKKHEDVTYRYYHCRDCGLNMSRRSKDGVDRWSQMKQRRWSGDLHDAVHTTVTEDVLP